MRCLHSVSVALLLTGCTPDTPAEPTEAETRDVTIDGLFAAEGTLHLPATPDGAPVAAVVLVHGSGPQSRDVEVSGQLNMGFGSSFLMFKQLAKQLQAQGIAVLRYDKRSCGEFNGLCTNDYLPPDPDTTTIQSFVSDANDAAAWLMAQPAIDDRAVFIVGHSQGGGMVPEILHNDPRIAGGISLAGPWRPVDALLRYQLDFSRDILEETGAPQAQIDASLASLAQMVDQLEALRDGTLEEYLIAGVPVPFWQSWMDSDDARPGLVADEYRPLFSIQGDYDWNVPAELEQPGWWEAGVETLTLPCITHALNCVSQPDYTQIGPQDIELRVDPSVTEAIVRAVTEGAL